MIEVNDKLGEYLYSIFIEISSWAIARNYEAIILMNMDRNDDKTIKAEALAKRTIKVRGV